MVNPVEEEEEPHQKYKDDGFFPTSTDAAPKMFGDLLKETGYNVEEDKSLLETGKRFDADQSRYLLVLKYLATRGRAEQSV